MRKGLVVSHSLLPSRHAWRYQKLVAAASPPVERSVGPDATSGTCFRCHLSARSRKAPQWRCTRRDWLDILMSRITHNNQDVIFQLPTLLTFSEQREIWSTMHALPEPGFVQKASWQCRDTYLLAELQRLQRN
ncbi:hypothetical protein ACJJTC_013960 [Scirpophaga incertulas]